MLIFFFLIKNLITLSNLNVTTFDIYNKVIFDSDENCKLIVYFDIQYYEIYNLLIIDFSFIIICELFVFFDIDEIFFFVDIDTFNNIINVTFINN